MRTEISYWSNKVSMVDVVAEGVWKTAWACPSTDFNRRHEGVWNSRVLAFVPQLEDQCSDCGYNAETGYVERCSKHPVDVAADTFSDGTPVASYEQFN